MRGRCAWRAGCAAGWLPSSNSPIRPEATMTVSVPAPPALEKVYRTELSPVSFLRRSAFVYPDKIAVVHGERRYTYREFHERVNRLASALAGAGVEAGDRVAFLCPNTPALLEAHFAVPAAGAVLVAINTRLAAGGGAPLPPHPRARGGGLGPQPLRGPR